VPVAWLDGALVVTASAILPGAMVLDAQGNGSTVIAIPNVPAAQRRDIHAQGVAWTGSSLVATAAVSTRTQ
jgi:hypothetical protein